MDLSQLDTVTGANDGADMAVYAPDGEKTDIVIRLLGADSDAFRRAQRKRQDRRLSMLQKRGKQKLSSAEIEEEDLALLAACTVSWKNIEEGGKALECNQSNAERLYRDFPDIRRQVDEFIGDSANFLGQ